MKSPANKLFGPDAGALLAPGQVLIQQRHTGHRMQRLRNSILFGTFILLCIACLSSATRVEAETVVLAGATVHTITGETLSPGQVLIRDGKIAAVGVTIPGVGAEIIDLQGQHLYPGLIALNTVLGLTEISGVRSTQDTTEVGDYTPEVESWTAVNPDSELIPVARANGVAYFQAVPQGGIISGQSGLVGMDGWTVEQRTFKKPVALHVFWPSMELMLAPRERGKQKSKAKSMTEQSRERRGKLRALDDFFEEARAYAKARQAAAGGGTTEPIPAWEAMLPYLRGELPVMIHADDVRQIKAAVQWASTNNLKLILAGGRDAAMAATLLASNRVPIVFSDIFTLPSRDTEAYDVYFRTPEALRKAGVKVAFSFGSTSFDAGLVRNLPYCAAQAIAFGLPKSEALKGITLYPAQIAGVADRLGSIEAGKEATLFSADGEIFDIRSNVKRMWVAGKPIDLESRHTRLYQKYKSRPPVRQNKDTERN